MDPTPPANPKDGFDHDKSFTIKTSSSPKQSSLLSKYWKYLAATLICLIALIWLFVSLSGRDQSALDRRVDEILSLIDNRQCQTANTQFSTQGSTSRPLDCETIDDLAQNNAAFVVNDQRPSPSVASNQYEMVLRVTDTENGDTYEMSLYMVSERGDWKIESSSLFLDGFFN